MGIELEKITIFLSLYVCLSFGGGKWIYLVSGGSRTTPASASDLKVFFSEGCVVSGGPRTIPSSATDLKFNLNSF